MSSVKGNDKFAALEKDGVVVLHPRRSILDLTLAREFSEVLEAASAAKGAILVDLSRVEYLDSVVISLLVKAYVNLRQEGRRLVLLGLEEYVEDLLKSTGLLDVMDICHDLGSAMKLAAKPVDPAEIASYSRKD